MRSNIVFETSFIRTGGIGVGAILATAASYFFTTLPSLKAQIVGWIGVVFFGLGTVASALLFRGGPRVIVDEIGIHDLRMKGEPFSWDEISFLAISEVHSQRLLSIYLHAEDERVSRFSAWTRMLCQLNKSMGLPAINISFAGLTPGLKEAWDFIQIRYPEKVRAIPPSEASSDVPA